MNSTLFLLCLSMGRMRKQGLKKLEEVWKSSHMTVPVSGEKRKQWHGHVNAQKWGWEHCIHKKPVRERDLDTPFTLLRKIYATFCHANFQARTFSGCLVFWEKIKKEWMDFKIIGRKTWNPCEQLELCAAAAPWKCSTCLLRAVYLSTGMVLVAVTKARQHMTRMHPFLAAALSLPKTMKSCLIMNWMNMIWTSTMKRNTRVRKICVSDVQCKWRTFPLLVVPKTLIS